MQTKHGLFIGIGRLNGEVRWFSSDWYTVDRALDVVFGNGEESECTVIRMTGWFWRSVADDDPDPTTWYGPYVSAKECEEAYHLSTDCPEFGDEEEEEEEEDEDEDDKDRDTVSRGTVAGFIDRLRQDDRFDYVVALSDQERPMIGFHSLNGSSFLVRFNNPDNVTVSGVCCSAQDGDMFNFVEVHGNTIDLDKLAKW